MNKEKQIEELIRENESLAKTVNEASSLIRKLRNKVEKSRGEVAREIFEEIEKQTDFFRKYMFLNNSCKAILGVLDELKKKYTEGENEN